MRGHRGALVRSSGRAVRASPYARAATIARAVVRQGPQLVRAYRAGKQLGAALKRRLNGATQGGPPSKKRRTSGQSKTGGGSGSRGVGYGDMQKDIKLIRCGTIRLPGMRKAPKPWKLLGKVQYHRQVTGTITNVEGKQAVAQLFEENDAGKFLAGTAIAPGYFSMDPRYSAANTIDLGAGAGGISTVAPYSAAHAKVQRTHRMFYTGFSGQTTFYNFSPIPTVVHFYLFTPKNNLNKTPQSLWHDYMIYEGQIDATAATYPTSVAAAVGGSPDENAFGQLPEQCRELRRDYRVLRHYKFELDGGSSKRFEYFVKFNRVLSEERLLELDVASTYLLKDLYVYGMAIMQPGVVDETKGGDGPTWGLGKVAYISDSTHTFRFMDSSMDIKYFVPGVPSETVGIAEKMQSNIDTSIDPTVNTS